MSETLTSSVRWAVGLTCFALGFALGLIAWPFYALGDRITPTRRRSE